MICGRAHSGMQLHSFSFHNPLLTTELRHPPSWRKDGLGWGTRHELEPYLFALEFSSKNRFYSTGLLVLEPWPTCPATCLALFPGASSIGGRCSGTKWPGRTPRRFLYAPGLQNVGVAQNGSKIKCGTLINGKVD